MKAGGFRVNICGLVDVSKLFLKLWKVAIMLLWLKLGLELKITAHLKQGVPDKISIPGKIAQQR